MKNYFTTLSILILCSSVVCAYNSYSYTKPQNNLNKSYNVYNPYAYKINPFAADPFTNVRNEMPIKQRIKLIRQILRVKNGYYSGLLSWSPFVRSNPQGALTGYSVPINQDIYQGLGANTPKGKQRANSPTCNTDLFTLPGNDNYIDYGNGNKKKDNGGVGAKTGVTIIYD